MTIALPPVRCPCCGAVLAPGMGHGVPADVAQALALIMGKATIHGAILRKLTDRFGEEVLADQLIWAVYGPFGGPLTVRNTLRVHISRLRHVLRPLGLAIVGTRYPAGYRLERALQI